MALVFFTDVVLHWLGRTSEQHMPGWLVALAFLLWLVGHLLYSANIISSKELTPSQKDELMALLPLGTGYARWRRVLRSKKR
jgi:hypothetical protein